MFRVLFRRLSLILKGGFLELSSGICGGGIFKGDFVGDRSSLIDGSSCFGFTVAIGFSFTWCWGIAGIFSV